MAGFFAILIGLFTAFARLSNSISGRVISTFYLEAIRNTPLLVQLFLFYFVLAPIFGIDRFWAGILCLAVTSREVVRLFLEQLRFDFVPVFHYLQGRFAA